MKKTITSVVLCAGLALCMTFPGFAGTAQENEVKQETSLELNTLGSPSGEGEILQARLTNASGKNITRFWFCPEEELQTSSNEKTEEPQNLLTDGDVFVDGESRVLYFDLSLLEDGEDVKENPAANVNSDDPSPIILELGFEDGSEQVLYVFPIQESEEITLVMENETLFFEYVSSENGDVISTLEDELEQFYEHYVILENPDGDEAEGCLTGGGGGVSW